MNKQEIKLLFKDDVDVRRTVIRDYIKDQNNTYEDRKEVWLQTPDHLCTNKQWTLHLNKFDKKYGEISWYDDFYVERYSDFDLRSAIEIQDEWDEEKQKDFITECMDMGIHGFNEDW